jgi:hypothetical protein
MTTFATVDFGDITAVSLPARFETLLQMIGGVILVGVVARVLISDGRLREGRRSSNQTSVRRWMRARASCGPSSRWLPSAVATKASSPQPWPNRSCPSSGPFAARGLLANDLHIGKRRISGHAWLRHAPVWKRGPFPLTGARHREDPAKLVSQSAKQKHCFILQRRSDRRTRTPSSGTAVLDQLRAIHHGPEWVTVLCWLMRGVGSPARLRLRRHPLLRGVGPHPMGERSCGAPLRAGGRGA